MKLLDKQIWHLTILLILLFGVCYYIKLDKTLLEGSLWNIETKQWLIFAISIPIVHQVYVLVCWRLELHYKLLSKTFGKNAFKIYVIGFFILFVSRLIFIIFLAESNKETFQINPILKYTILSIISLLALYTFYSVKVYFGMDRAAGLDHFDSEIRKLPFVKKSIFKYTNNGMYVYAFLIIYVPSFLYQSKSAFIVAVFSHLYIWVHYYCTELPDIKIIYRNVESKN
jgi:hypothetical protein